MKPTLYIAVISISMSFCNEPKNITANPDKQTTTSGTLGSAKMTNELPSKSDSSAVKPDSIRLNH